MFFSIPTFRGLESVIFAVTHLSIFYPLADLKLLPF